MPETDSRLQDTTITDHIWRAHMYSKIREYVRLNENGDVISYFIKEDEETRPDLAAFRAYRGRTELRWVIVLMAGNSDEMEPLPVGYTILLPPVIAVRKIIREVKDAYGTSV